MNNEVIVTPANDRLTGIGSKKIVQLNFVVKDLEQVKATWGKILAGAMTAEYTVPPFDYAPTYTDGKREDCDDVRTLKFVLEDEMVLAFWQPGSKKTPWKEYLDKHGESLMSVEFNVPDLDKAYEVIREATGVAGPYHRGIYPNMSYSFVDTSQQLGTELNICIQNNTEGDMRV